MARLNALDRKTALQKKRQQIEAQLKALEIRDKEIARKEDTRRKVIAGALALAYFENHPDDAFSQKLLDMLVNGVEPRSRYLFPFLPHPDAMPDAAPPPAPARRPAAMSRAAVAEVVKHHPAPAVSAPSTPAVAENAPVPSHPAENHQHSGQGNALGHD